MIEIIKNKTFVWWEIAILGLLIFIPICISSPILNEDTGGYLNFDIERPPLYCIFLWFFHVLGKFQLTAAHWAQGIINFFALLYFGAWLHYRLKLEKILIYSILLIPILIFYMYFRILSSVSAEAIAFPLFIMTFIFLIESFSTFNLKTIIFLTITSNLLILTREQFYYFYFIFFILIAWYFWKPIKIKNIFLSITIIILSILLTASINRTYHYLIHHQFKDSSAVGSLLMTQALYLSNTKSEKYFNNPFEKEVFKHIIQKLQSENLTKESAPKIMYPLIVENLRAHYDLTHDRILEIAKSSLPTSTSPYRANNIFFDISKILYLNSMKENLRFYLWRVSYFVGNIWICFSMILCLFVIVFRNLIDRKYNFTTDEITIVVSFVVILANASFVPIFAHFEQRYCFYSYFLYFVLAGLLGKSFLKKEKII